MLRYPVSLAAGYQ